MGGELALALDHWYGTEVYQRAFPDVRIVAHEKTRALMIGPALAFNRPGLETALPAYLKNLEQRAASDQSLRPLLEEDRFFLEQKSRVRHVFPNVTFSKRLSIELGERRIELRHYGRAVTPGDAVIYLPHEKILLLGDLIVNPITFALSGYPTEWLKALEAIDALDATLVKLTGDDPAKNHAFRTQLVDWYLHRVYDELDGPLTDAIAAIPAS